LYCIRGLSSAIADKTNERGALISGIELPPPARKTIDLEGRIVKDGVKKALRDHQLALAELVHAIQHFRKIADSKR
jgi:hypothetical protein